MSVRELACDITLDTNTLEADIEVGNPVIVEVHDDVNIEALTVTENGTYEAESGIDGYAPVTVAVPEYQPEIEALTITENGTYTASGDGYNPVTVAVPEPTHETEEWVFTLDDDSTVTKVVILDD